MSGTELYEGFSDLPPEIAGAIQGTLTKVAQEVEEESKLAESDAKEIAALKKAYDALDMLIQAPGPVDFVAKELVIPRLPEFFRWLTEQLHKLGIFTHAKK